MIPKRMQQWSKTEQHKLLLARLMEARKILAQREQYPLEAIDLAIAQEKIISDRLESHYHF